MQQEGRHAQEHQPVPQMVVCKKTEHQQYPSAAPPFDHIAHNVHSSVVYPYGYTCQSVTLTALYVRYIPGCARHPHLYRCCHDASQNSPDNCSELIWQPSVSIPKPIWYILKAIPNSSGRQSDVSRQWFGFIWKLHEYIRQLVRIHPTAASTILDIWYGS